MYCPAGPKREDVMDVSYFSCDGCGFEGKTLSLSYSREDANGDLCLCPHCGCESSNFIELTAKGTANDYRSMLAVNNNENR